jgi:hypothetical protein
MKEEWRDYWDAAKGKLYIEVTNEKKKKGAVADGINNALLQYLQYKPQLDADPEARRIFNELMQVVGLKPVDFSNSTPAQSTPQAQPAQPGKTAVDNPEQLSAKPQ